MDIFLFFYTESFIEFNLFLSCFPKNALVTLKLNCCFQIIIELLSFLFITILYQSVFDFLLIHADAADCLHRKDCGGLQLTMFKVTFTLV